jgi:hypothetical protein
MQGCDIPLRIVIQAWTAEADQPHAIWSFSLRVHSTEIGSMAPFENPLRRGAANCSALMANPWRRATCTNFLEAASLLLSNRWPVSRGRMLRAPWPRSLCLP